MPLISLIIFTGFTAYSMLNFQESLIDFATRLMSSLDTAQVGIDLYKLCAFLMPYHVITCIWMYQDNRGRGRGRGRGNKVISDLPYFLITAVFASIGPLLYLVVNTAKRYHGDTKIEQAHVVRHKSGC